MANNTTFILPEWLIAKEPGMNCRSHQYILGMFATYNLVAIILSVILASPFFVNVSRNVQQVILPWNWCKESGGSPDEEPSPLAIAISYIATVLGSIAIALAAPLLAGNTIVKNHPNVNRWTIIEQWSTRPRATIFVFIFNLLAADMFKGSVTQGFAKTATSSIISEIVMELFGIKFLMKQTSVSLQKFDPKLPCTEPASDATQIPANCPAMQQGAIGLAVLILINALLVVFLFLCLPCARGDNKKGELLLAVIFFVILCMIFMVYVESWVIWRNFLHETPEDLYCIEGSALVDLIYCLLPVVLGLWRLLWAMGAGK